MKPKVQMKKMQRIFSFLLAAVMLTLTLSAAVFAEPAENDTAAGEDEALPVLLKLSSLNQNAVVEANNDAKITGQTAQYGARFAKEDEDPTVIYASGAQDKGKHMPYGLVALTTNLPISIQTRYTIEFFVKQEKCADYKIPVVLGFHASKESLGGAFAQLYSGGERLAANHRWWNRATYAKAGLNEGGYYQYQPENGFWKDHQGTDGYTRITLTLYGSVMSVYCGDTLLGAYDILRAMGTDAISNFNEFATMKIAGGFSTQNSNDSYQPWKNSAVTADDAMLSIKDITVYSGIKGVSDPPAMQQSELLLSLNNLSAEGKTDAKAGITVSSMVQDNNTVLNFAGRKAASGKIANAKSTAFDATDDGIYVMKDNQHADKSISPYGSVAVKTNLVLDCTRQYTVTYSVKKEAGMQDTLWPYFGFCGNDYDITFGAAIAISPDGKKVAVLNRYWMENTYCYEDSESYGPTELDSSVWDYADENGYCSFTITMNGFILSFYCNGEKLASYDIFSKAKDGHGASNSNNFYGSLRLMGGFYDPAEAVAKDASMPAEYKPSIKPNTDTLMLRIKDISLYSGIYGITEEEFRKSNPNMQFVAFYTPDGQQALKEKLVNGSVTVESFPEVTVAKRDIVWINQNTGALVEAPATFHESTNVLAVEKGLNASTVAGVQCSEVMDGKVNLRIIGGVYNLDGSSVGFDVTVRYTDKNGEEQKKTCRVSGTKVFDSVQATESGNIRNVTAHELGVCYLYALVIEDIPADIGEIQLTVKSFKATLAGGLRISGDEKTVTFNPGEVSG